ncbi:hypothetical protein GCM10028868_24260 [Virgibacillus kimchii]
MEKVERNFLEEQAELTEQCTACRRSTDYLAAVQRSGKSLKYQDSQRGLLSGRAALIIHL